MIRISLYDTNGTQQAQLVGHAEGGYTSLAYRRVLNAPGLAQLTLSGGNALLSAIQMGWTARVHRLVDGVWDEELFAIVAGIDWKHDEEAVAAVTLDGIESILDSRVIAYPAGTAGRNAFLDAETETIMKALVKYNATAAGNTGDGRVRNAAAGYPYNRITVEPDGRGGSKRYWYCAWRNLLEQLQELGDDFQLAWVDGTTWQFKYGTIGANKSSSIIFALDRHNLLSPEYTLSERDARTVGIVAGQGEGDDREIEVVYADEFSADYDKEVFIDARDVEEGSAAGLAERGLAQLNEFKRLETFSFHVAQVPNARYKVDYDLGDIVTVRNPVTMDDYIMRIAAVTVSEDSNGKEIIDIEVANARL